MKKLFFLIFAICSLPLFAQEKETIKPEYVIIVNNEIITKEKLQELGQQGLVKSMNKGVTEEERNKLAEKFGDKIGDREFVIEVDLLTEKEIAERQKEISSDNKKAVDKEELNDEFKLKINDTATEFTVQMIDGEVISISDLKGKVVLLNFWATWCAPCLMEFSEFPEKILQPFKNEEFILIAISIGETKETVEQKMQGMKKYGVDFNVGIDPAKEIWDKYATGSIPKSFLIDKNGVIRYTSIGNADGNVDKLATEIKNLLKE